MQLLDGKALSSKILAEVKQKVAALPVQLGLAVVLVGDNPASTTYVAQKRKAAESVGINFFEIKFPESVTTEELLAKITELNADQNIHGILVQLPLPEQVDKAAVLPAISPAKDVDGFHPLNHGRNFVNLASAVPPATPAGIIRLLDEYKLELKGKEIVVVGHSNIVGKPLAIMLINRNATVTVCHEFTKDLSAHTRNADIIVSATGVVHLIKAEMVKDGVIIVDVGGKKVDGKLVGDVDFAGVKEKAGYITPVPGGVGPMTVATLMENVLRCYSQLTI